MEEAIRVRGPEDGQWWEKGDCGQEKVGKTEGEEDLGLKVLGVLVPGWKPSERLQGRSRSTG